MNKYNPVIVVVAFNRPRSLERLLYSLKNAKKINNARLIISIDNLEPNNYDVKEIAEAFQWPFGEKEVIYQKQRLGLRKHVLQCGDYARKYGSVIILEDDLFVSPYFYDFAVRALEYYNGDEIIAGISLYGQPREEIGGLPFLPFADNSDIFFLQFPSSLGQVWTRKQWENFKSWYEKMPILNNINLPAKIMSWPETSWKKYFCAYLLAHNKYFVFPRHSLTTNFNDPGSNLKMHVNHEGQTPLRIFEKEYKFCSFDDSVCKYDIYFEILPECIQKLNPDFNNISFEMDLYGMKNLSNIKAPYIISSKPTKKPIKGFKRALKPQDMNIILNLVGADFHLSEKSNVLPFKNKKLKMIGDYQYYYYRRLPSIKLLIYNYIIKRLKLV